jgi:hypothetical protein
MDSVLPENFIYPLFIHTKDHNEKIDSMPGCERHSADSVLKEVNKPQSPNPKPQTLRHSPDSVLGDYARTPENSTPKPQNPHPTLHPPPLLNPEPSTFHPSGRRGGGGRGDQHHSLPQDPG